MGYVVRSGEERYHLMIGEGAPSACMKVSICFAVDQGKTESDPASGE
ncbi:hypothetical protein [Rhodococcus ruber]|nr:hypothetical protein [Rhodococcus ruber]